MQISLVTDEISADFETAIELGAAWGILDFELRSVGTQRAPHLADFQKQRIRELLDEYRARIVAISPGLFKIPYPPKNRARFALQVIDANLFQKWRDARSLVDYHLQELLPASLAYAQELGAQQVIVFSFGRDAYPPGPAPDEVVECLQRAAAQAQAAGLQLAVEVENGYWADTGRHTADLLRAVNHPALGVNWDPGNALEAGDHPYPEGYQAVREVVRHVHFKDVTRSPSGEYRYAVQGEIDWAGQIRALAADGYDGFISVESHLQPKVASAKALTLRLQALLAAASPGA